MSTRIPCTVKWTLLTLLTSLLTLCQGQVPFHGSCPVIRPLQIFDAPPYLGLWYQYSNYLAIFQTGGRCVTATYSDLGSGKIGVVNTQVNLFGKSNSITGQAVPVDAASSQAKYTVSFPGTPLAAFTTDTDGNYWVLDTDYTSYAIVWDCSDVLILNTQFLWILTRERSPPASIISRAEAKIAAMGLSVSKLSKTDQTNCT